MLTHEHHLVRSDQLNLDLWGWGPGICSFKHPRGNTLACWRLKTIVPNTQTQIYQKHSLHFFKTYQRILSSGRFVLWPLLFIPMQISAFPMRPSGKHVPENQSSWKARKEALGQRFPEGLGESMASWDLVSVHTLVPWGWVRPQATWVQFPVCQSLQQVLCPCFLVIPLQQEEAVKDRGNGEQIFGCSH